MTKEIEKRPLYNILAFEDDTWREFFRFLISLGAGLSAIVILGFIQTKAEQILTNPELITEIEQLTNALMVVSFVVFEGLAALHVLNMTDRTYGRKD